MATATAVVSKELIEGGTKALTGFIQARLAEGFQLHVEGLVKEMIHGTGMPPSGPGFLSEGIGGA